MKASKEFWDKSAHRYAKSPVRDEAIYQKKLAITQGYFQPDWSVLEFGCGTGSTALVHAPHVKDILATDISGKMLDIATQKARDSGHAKGRAGSVCESLYPAGTGVDADQRRIQH